MVSPLSPNELNFVRERALTEVARRFAPLPNVARVEQVEEMFNKAAFVSNKANVLARSLGNEARKYFIPVPQGLTDVRTAVGRKSEDGNEDRISFDLFKNAIEAKQLERKELEQVTVSGMINTDAAFSKEVRRVKCKHGLRAGGIEPDAITVEMFISQFLILYLANTLMKPFSNLEEIMPASSLRKPQTDEETSQVPIIASILIGLACQLIVMGINEILMEEYMERAAGAYLPKHIKMKDLIARARQMTDAQAPKMLALYTGLSDYDVILRYSFDYLSKTVDPGYEFWVAYADTVQIRYTAQSLWVHAPYYSIPHALVSRQQLPYSVNAPPHQKDLERLKFIRDVALQIMPMANVHYQTRNEILENSDNALDTIAQVLNSAYVKDAIICFSHFFLELPPKTRKLIRGFTAGMLRAQRNDLRPGIIQLGAEVICPSFEEFMALEVAHQIDRVFDKAANDFMAMVSPELGPLMCCPIVGEVIQVVMETLFKLEEQLKRALKILTIKVTQKIDDILGVNRGGVMYRAQIEYESRILRQIIRIMDQCIQIAQTVDTALPPFKTVPQEMYVPNLTLDPGEIQKYFGSADEKNFPNGRFLPALGEEIAFMPVQAFYREKARIEGKHTCMSPDSDKDITAATDFIRDYTNNPSGTP